MIESFNVVQISSPGKEQFRVYSETKYIGFKTHSVKKKKNLIQNRTRSNFRAHRRIKELLDINFSYSFTFMTLTFRENIKDLSTANKSFTQFIKKIKWYMTKKNSNFSLKYLCVVETQKRGAIHYHIVCNLPIGLNFNEITILWKKTIDANKNILIKGGTVNIQYSKDYHINIVSNYLCKYLLKSKANPLFLGKKIYFTSRNLKKKIRNNHYIDLSNSDDCLIDIEKKFEKDLKTNY